MNLQYSFIVGDEEYTGNIETITLNGAFLSQHQEEFNLANNNRLGVLKVQLHDGLLSLNCEIVYFAVYENNHFPTGIGIVFCEVDEDARRLVLKLNLAAKLVEFSNNLHKASMAYNHIA
jgi:hypothetical protein